MEDLLMAEDVGGFLAILAGMLLIGFIVLVAIYVYLGFAFMKIGKKANLKTPALAWIPGVGPLIIAFQASKMHWWPWLLLIGLIIPFLNFLYSLSMLAFCVFAIIWLWKMYESIKRPGWWALLMLIFPVGLIMVGIAAWSKD